jgi:hypothetical protein
MIDFIQKDSNIYLLLDKLSIEKENLYYIEEFTHVIEKVAKENKYMKFEDGESIK